MRCLKILLSKVYATIHRRYRIHPYGSQNIPNNIISLVKYLKFRIDGYNIIIHII